MHTPNNHAHLRDSGYVGPVGQEHEPTDSEQIDGQEALDAV